MIGETQCQSDDRQGRVVRAASREYRTASDVEVGQGMHPAILVYNAERRITVHARRSHMVLVAVKILRPSLIISQVWAQSAKSCSSDLSPEKVESFGGFDLVFGQELPVDDDLAHAKAIALRSERDPTLRVRPLFGDTSQIQRLDRYSLSEQRLPQPKFRDSIEIANNLGQIR